MSWSGRVAQSDVREALSDVQEWPGGPSESREWSGGPPGCLEGLADAQE